MTRAARVTGVPNVPGNSRAEDHTRFSIDGAERVLEAIMFTDIEGSVSLEQTVGTERYVELLTPDLAAPPVTTVRGEVAR